MDTCMTAPSPLDTKEAPNVAPRCPSDTARILAAAHAAGRRIAPLWPLDNFVAVNPFLGLADLDFTQAAHLMARTAGARMAMPRLFYAEAIASGRISDSNLAKALAEAPSRHDLPADVAALKIAARADLAPLPVPLPTVSDVAGAVTGIDWSGFVRGRVSAWAAAYFDDGQAGWPAAWRDRGPYAAWRAEMAVDRTAEILGLPNVRRLAAALPETPEQAIVASVARLGLDQAPLDVWFQRLLMSVGG
ncbi:MAG: DUF2309 family protein [Enhydrobacter sp.]|nr:DUF2309 family protein [Enhydrobacter sp.]